MLPLKTHCKNSAGKWKELRTHKVFFLFDFDFNVCRSSINRGWFILKVLLLDVSAPCILFVWRRQTELSCCLIIFKIFFTADDNLFYFQCLYWALKLNTLKIATMLCVMQFFSTFNSCIIVNCWLYCQWFISAKIWGPSSSLLLLSACLGPGPCWCKLRTRQGL